MIDRHTSSGSTSQKGLLLSLQPAPAWTAILSFVFLSAVCIVVGAGTLLNLVFPVGALAVGVFLYARYPILYVGFSWWIWFLTPLIRRLADYRGSFTEPSPILLAPYLVTLVTLVTLCRYLPTAQRWGGLPFVWSIIGITYGFLTGLIQQKPIAVCIATLDWLVPVLFGFHLLIHWQNYPSYRQNILRVFTGGMLVASVYGIVQFVVAPPWDCLWLIKTGLVSAGRPAPLEIRVWGTGSSPGPFANFLRAGLLVLLVSQGSLRLPASAAGYLAFLLTLVRSAWGAWFLGVLSLTTSLKPKLQMRLFLTIMVIAVLVIPLTNIEPFASQISERMETLSSLEDDNSAQTRLGTYDKLLGTALTSLLGQGMGYAYYDSAVLNILFNLGWLGTIPFVGGLFFLSFKLFQGSSLSFDPLVGVSRAIVLGGLSQIPFGSPMVEIKGMLLWGFLGIGTAASKYYQHAAQLNSSAGNR